jgi:hypothetical protein
LGSSPQVTAATQFSKAIAWCLRARRIRNCPNFSRIIPRAGARRSGRSTTACSLRCKKITDPSLSAPHYGTVGVLINPKPSLPSGPQRRPGRPLAFATHGAYPPPAVARSARSGRSLAGAGTKEAANRCGLFVRLTVPVGTALDLVSARAARKGLALVGVPVFGVRSPPAEAHDLPAFWASRVIARAEGARQFVLLNGHKAPH